MTSNFGPVRTRGQYRKYLRDPSAPIPRSTLWRLRKSGALDDDDSGRLNDRHVGASSLISSGGFPISPEHSPLSSPEHRPSSPPSPLHLPGQSPLSSPEYRPSSSPSPLLSPGHTCGTSPLPDHGLSSFSSPKCASPPPLLPDHSPSPSSPLSDEAFGSELNDSYLQPLYPGASITVCGAYCSIMQYASANKLTYTAIEELLKLLQILCPCPNSLPTTLYRFKKFFQQYNSGFEQQRVCCKCFAFLDKRETCPTCVDADNPVCNPEMPGLLVHTPFQKPLQTVLSNCWEYLQRPPVVQPDGVLHDIWDGAGLREETKEGSFYSHAENLGLMLSTDGVPLFKSSSADLWPVFLVILNLPRNMRMNAQNIVLAGLWYGSKKPPMHLLLEPIIKRLDRLHTLGVAIETPHGLITYRAKVELAIFDLPAKAAVLCAKQFNGKYGCSVCLHPGEYSGRCQVYPPTEYPERTHRSVIAAARLAEATGKVVSGVKGVSPMSTTLDLVDSIPVDYMHAVLEGVTRNLLKHWFLPQYHSGAYYLGPKLSTIDKMLLRQQPPHELSRSPRSIQKHLKYFKASELRTWLLFYSLPLLLDNLPPLYFHHYALLVCAIHILLQDEIVPSLLDAAECMLGDFCKLLPELYGVDSCTANAHLLSHLPKYVRLWGPLWTHSAFGFENKNGHLKRHIHGRGNVIPQLMFNVDVSHTLQLVHYKLAQHESEQTMTFLNASSGLAPRSNMTQIGEHMYIIGRCHVKTPTSEQRAALGAEGPIACFYKLYKNGVVYHAAGRFSTGVCGKRDSTVCAFQMRDGQKHFGRIILFVNSLSPQALVREFCQPPQSILQQAGPPCRPALAIYKEVDILNSFITTVQENNASPLLAVPITDIQRKLIFVKTEVSTYVIKQPNQFEHH